MSEPGRVCINRRWWERDVVEGVWISDGGLDSPDVDDWPAACQQIADLTRELEAARAENARLREALVATENTLRGGPTVADAALSLAQRVHDGANLCAKALEAQR